ncbi:hypothetical protein Shyhy01_46340 [Streptomyces hygroscopicus subsp. hygroscopicus]|nr:hypothetical protein Shyhy01_46340 [Streptomyces hygroscopicus subsp. hygroscopicus]
MLAVIRWSAAVLPLPDSSVRQDSGGMTGNQIQGLIGMTATLAILVLLVLPSVLGILRDRRIDRQIRKAQEARETRGEKEAQKSSSRSTVPSTATWYADGRRSKKLVSS